jgi:hypothetical protein
MIDILIIFTGISNFIIFLFIHILILRVVKHTKVLMWTFISLIISILLGLLICLLVYKNIGFINSYDFLVYFVSASMLYFGLCTLYVFSIYGISTTSLRIRIMRILYNEGNKGLTKKQLNNIYNIDIMMKDSIRKLVESGEIGFEKGYYYFRNKLSYFNLHNKILTFYIRLINN